MSRTTRANIVKEVSEAAEIAKKEALAAFDRVFDALEESIQRGKPIRLGGRAPAPSVDASSVLEATAEEPAVRALAAAIEVFGELEKAKRFLSTAHPQFENHPPIDIALASEDGMGRLITFLNEIKFGLPA